MSFFSTAGLLVFCALLGSAFPLQCLSCNAAESDTCEESMIECSGTQCMTGSQFFHNGDLTVQSFYKGCAIEELCGLFGSVTEDSDVKIRVSAACCTGDNCNDDAFCLPAENTTLNGKSCPNSYCTDTTAECVSVAEQMCTGSETKCVDYRGEVQNPDGTVGNYSVKGCINDIGCFYNFRVLISAFELQRTLLSC